MEPVVRIGQRSVRGIVADGVRIFRGIPYAAAPVGARLPADWRCEFDARDFGPTAPQVSTAGIPGMPD
jgi:para-nitrobenzyl esterase